MASGPALLPGFSDFPNPFMQFDFDDPRPMGVDPFGSDVYFPFLHSPPYAEASTFDSFQSDMRYHQKHLKSNCTSARIGPAALPVPQVDEVMYQMSGQSLAVRNATDTDFEKMRTDPTVLVNPRKLDFIPVSCWSNQEVTLGSLIDSFFHKRNNPVCRFSHKLYDALRLSMAFPHLKNLIGVEWVNSTVLRVDKLAFARLLRIKAVDGSLFHQQGNFPSHGFVELNEIDARRLCGPEIIAEVDYDNVRLLKHQDGLFIKECSHLEIENCKWINSRKRR
jgi:hypothetical protein